MTQIVQQFTIRAQAREARRATGARIDRTERVANALGHLAGVITRLQALKTSGMKVRGMHYLPCRDHIYLDHIKAYCAHARCSCWSSQGGVCNLTPSPLTGLLGLGWQPPSQLLESCAVTRAALNVTGVPTLQSSLVFS